MSAEPESPATTATTVEPEGLTNGEPAPPASLDEALGKNGPDLEEAFQSGLSGDAPSAGADGGAIDAPTDVSPVSLPELDETAAPGDGHDLRLLSDIELELTVELGHSKLPLRQLLGLNAGSVLELDRTAGEPVDVLVNGTVVARGEVVVVDGDFGVRIGEIMDPRRGH